MSISFAYFSGCLYQNILHNEKKVSSFVLGHSCYAYIWFETLLVINGNNSKVDWPFWVWWILYLIVYLKWHPKISWRYFSLFLSIPYLNSTQITKIHYMCTIMTGEKHWYKTRGSRSRDKINVFSLDFCIFFFFQWFDASKFSPCKDGQCHDHVSLILSVILKRHIYTIYFFKPNNIFKLISIYYSILR